MGEWKTGSGLMQDPRLSWIEFTVDSHLDRLDPQERERLKTELERDPQLRDLSERVGQVLRPLDSWTAPPASPQLIDRTLLFLRKRTHQEGGLILHPAEKRAGIRRFVSLRDVLTAAACIALLFGVLVPSVSGVRSRSQRLMCAGNLATLYQGTSLYQQAFAGSLPYAGSVPGAAWLPATSDGLPFASNSRHVYLLLKLGLGPKPGDFICASNRSARPMASESVAARQDFADVRNVSYDTLNLSGPSPNLRPPTSIAYLSDANPLFIGGRFHDALDPDRTNSPSHRGIGQNVLSLDGRAELMKTPLYGSRRDNLWLAGDIRRYAGTETPKGPEDAFLVPGFPEAH